MHETAAGNLDASYRRHRCHTRIKQMMSTQEHFDSSTPEMMPTRFVRRDFLSAHIVEVGLLLQEQFGVEHAAAFLKDNFIHLDVAMRVLLRPSERRRHQA
jgi:hypothetical protein